MGGRLLKERNWEELAEPARYDAKTLAKLCQISNRQLQREFCRQLGRSPQKWLDDQRMVAARQLLLAGKPIKEVAADLGFKQTSHFCRSFKSTNSITASEFILYQLHTALPSSSQTTNVAHR